MPDISIVINIPVLDLPLFGTLALGTGIFILYWVGKAIISVVTGG